MTSPGTARPRIEGLTGLRFIAAAMIVVHHLQGLLWIEKGALSAVNLGNGVSFFFCLSGFILHYNYRDKIAAIPYWRFVARRFFRLWPAHVTVLALAALVFYPNVMANMLKSIGWPGIAAVALLQQSWVPNMTVYYAWNGPSWSISTELVFYVFFPLLSVWMARRAGATFMVVLAVVAAWLVFAQLVLFDPSIRGNAHGLGAINPIPRLYEFAAGILLCEVLIRTRALGPGSGGTARWTAYEVAAVVAVAGLLVVTRSIMIDIHNQIWPVVWSWLGASIMAPAFCGLIVIIARGHGHLSRFLSSAPMVWLGNVSFAAYLTHQPLITFFRRNGIADLPAPLGVSSMSRRCWPCPA
ncbi:acyltransferase family protein [Microbaculum sp. FT89]|uniref:acyltransferase family protein n=1 Tax=Microbaculum sp. FT89 TaxID=3447298 RepID=UPI003F53AA91